MPVFGLGTYNMGLGDDQKDITAIRAAINAGVSHIDTAENYAEGHCEELVGEAIKNYVRSKIFLVSKAGSQNLSFRGIKLAIKGSLERLGTDYLDLYLMHRCPTQNKFEECVEAMNELVDEGLVKHIGLSNTNAKHSAELQNLSKQPFVANQVHYNLQFREPEKDGLLNYCQKNDMLLIAWRPVNKGGLNKSGIDITKPGVKILDELCKKYNKTPAQIAINWLINQKNVVTLSKTSTLAHLADNLGSVGWQMEQSDVEILTTQFPSQEMVSDTVSLS